MIEKSEDKDYCEKICCCYNTNLRNGLNFLLAESNFVDLNQKTKLLIISGKLILNQNIFDSFNNKSPPFLIS